MKDIALLGLAIWALADAFDEARRRALTVAPSER